MVLIGGKPDRVVECIKIILDLISEVMFIKFILSLAFMNVLDINGMKNGVFQFLV